MTSPSASDIVEICQTQARYGYLMDDLAWHSIDEVFTSDCTFDATIFGLEPAVGFDAVRAMHEAADPPLAHHVTNVLVDDVRDGVATVRSKALGTYSKGRAFSGEYRDTMVRTAGGWRIRHRVVVLPREAGARGEVAS